MAALGAVVSLAAVPSPASAEVTWIPRDLTLRLADLGPGYDLGNDASCDLFFDDEKKPPDPRDFDYLTELLNECGVDFRQKWVPPGETPGPERVESYGWLLPTPAAAAREFRRWRRSDPRRGSPIEVGDAALLYGSDQALELKWRSGRVLARVLIDSIEAPVSRDMALELAHRQQARIAQRTKLKPRHLFDADVALDDPDFGVPVFWLGRHFRPGHGLPPLHLTEAYGGGGDFEEGPGWTGELDYELPRGRRPWTGSVTVGIWEPEMWRRARERSPGTPLSRSPCTKARHVSFPGIVIDAYAGYWRNRNRCDGRPRDAFVAVVQRGGVVITVNMELCDTCPRSRPYRSLKGLEAVAKGLRPRLPRR
jgi:hypothetical protein